MMLLLFVTLFGTPFIPLGFPLFYKFPKISFIFLVLPIPLILLLLSGVNHGHDDALVGFGKFVLAATAVSYAFSVWLNFFLKKKTGMAKKPK